MNVEDRLFYNEKNPPKTKKPTIMFLSMHTFDIQLK